jgi:hypothetical protein
MSEPDHNETGRRGPGWMATVVACCLVLYVPSIGPAAWLAVKIDGGYGGRADATIAPLYRPVEWIAKAIGCKQLLVDYVTWFIT